MGSKGTGRARRPGPVEKCWAEDGGTVALRGQGLTCLLGQGRRDSVQPGCGSRPPLWTGWPVPALELRPSDGSPAHTGALPAPRRHHGHCQGGSRGGLRGQVGALSSLFQPHNPVHRPTGRTPWATVSGRARPAGGRWALCGHCLYGPSPAPQAAAFPRQPEAGHH